MTLRDIKLKILKIIIKFSQYDSVFPNIDIILENISSISYKY